MYIVVFRDERKIEKYDFINQFYHAFTGGYTHCEIVFEQNAYFDALLISAMTPDGFPLYVKNRTFHSPDGRYKYCFYQYEVSHAIESELKNKCMSIASEKKHQLSYNKMLSTVLPEWILILKEFILTAIGMPLSYTEKDYKTTEAVYCVDMVRKVFEGILPVDWDENITPQELVLFLLEQKRITYDKNDETELKERAKVTDSVSEKQPDDENPDAIPKKKFFTIKEKFQRSFEFTGEKSDWV